MKRSDFIDYLLQFAPGNITENEMDVLEQFAFKIFDGTQLNEYFSLREQLAKAQEPLSVIVSSYGDGWYDGFIKAKEINQHSDYNEIGDCDYNGSVILRMSEYAESEYAKILIIKGRLD